MKYVITYYRNGRTIRFRHDTLEQAKDHAERIYQLTNIIVGIQAV